MPFPFLVILIVLVALGASVLMMEMRKGNVAQPTPRWIGVLNRSRAIVGLLINATALGVGGALLQFLVSKTVAIAAKAADVFTQVITGGQGILDVVERGIMQTN